MILSFRYCTVFCVLSWFEESVNFLLSLFKVSFSHQNALVVLLIHSLWVSKVYSPWWWRWWWYFAFRYEVPLLRVSSKPFFPWLVSSLVFCHFLASQMTLLPIIHHEGGTTRRYHPLDLIIISAIDEALSLQPWDDRSGYLLDKKPEAAHCPLGIWYFSVH